MSISVTLVSIPVADQDAAERFYTEKLGFAVRHDVPAGDARWLTVGAEDGPEILLEPRGMAEAVTYYEYLYNNGIPVTQLSSDDLDADHARLSELGVKFTMAPTDMGQVKVAVFDDTAGNLVQLAELLS